ncbi:MAG: Digeranylgeranylglyceryl phosphate synthase [Candidatus Methanofastidiosum methylothiophilum]|uniref:Digeranylgeranylglyceryl phosphate synthase n=1 Tax=Candidatus Methanofastidiosum methylothiophilum TaxID=1705564 RepID=A0A150ILE1_9EURY|nr:MAG: Digeranylgeranylglyceryl phosphate synthase [Candidatus Methanofastidiosum methylthiophilus]KYC48090.1 MAG: Digeranylgeranylglyceryl phosphate synthase [Candidatus Methanofastidiosum methylthiophilus]KYC49492.1 MAG: Digeranylgeranylglyceryl phosphate synthase [Candidatus Methanofastidiosum methylthiophilus]
MTWLAYTLGALCSFKLLGTFNLIVYFIGYVALFLIEFATVVSNEYYDYETDKINKNYSQFTGGSRMIVEGNISFNQAKTAILTSLILVFILMIFLTIMYNIYTILILSIGVILGLAYTSPPIKFSYRGLGEMDVAVTHSFYIVLAGFLLQTPRIDIVLPWILSIPIFFAVLGGIILAGIPDYKADRETGKRTLTVIFGKKYVYLISSIAIMFSIICCIFLIYYKIIGFASLFFLIAIIHGFALLYLLLVRSMSSVFENRIDKLLKLSLSYIIWFTLIPILYLLNIF